MKNVAIKIKQVRQLVAKLGLAEDLRPFCFYQFYDEEEHFTRNGESANALIEDTKAYELIYKEKFVNYLKGSPLVIHILDDATPLNAEEDEEGSSELGIAKIPLIELLTSGRIDKTFPVHNARCEDVGVIEVELGMSDTVDSHVMT
jgi:hypothetical protein